MKFKVKQGFVCILANKVPVGDGKFETQQSMSYGGTIVDFTAEQANQHGHKLEALDDDAVAWVASHAPRVADPLPFGISAEQLQVLTREIARQLLAGSTQAPL
jgi:hypothetical protein